MGWRSKNSCGETECPIYNTRTPLSICYTISLSFFGLIEGRNKAAIIFLVFTLLIFPFKTEAYASEKPDVNNMIYLYGGSLETYKSQLSITKNLVGTVVPGYFEIDQNGNLIDHVDPEFVQYAQQNGYKVTPFISNHWDPELGKKALANRWELAEQLAQAAINYNLDGVDIDIENLSETEREAQTEFLQLLVERLRPYNKTVSIAVAPVQKDTELGWFGSYDFEKIGQTVDKVFIMAYEQHWLSGPPGPQAGLEWTEATIRYLSNKIPKEKLVLGIPFYGRYWTEGIDGEAFTFTQANNLLKQNKAKWKWNRTYKSTFSKFTDRATSKKYEIWLDNADSLMKKIALVEKYGLKGWGGWRLGQEDPRIWDLLEKARAKQIHS